MSQWKEYKLGELLSYEQPTPFIVESTEYSNTYKTPVLTAGKSFILGYTNEKEGVYQSTPVIIFDDFTTSSQYVPFPFKVKSSAMKILTANLRLVLPKFIYYRMQIIRFDCSTHKRYWIQQYSKIPVMIPSIPEQERIISRIEELLSQLDNSAETLNKVKQQLAMYRQAVLKEAFSSITDYVTMDKVATMIDPQPSHRTPPEYDGGVPYIGIGDIDYDKSCINFDGAHKVNPAVLREQKTRYTLQRGDFVMGKIGTIGKPFRVHLPQNYTLSANIILIQPKREKINSDYLYWQFVSPYIERQLSEGSKATTQAAFGIKKARLLKIKMCGLDMQEIIVRRIEKELSVCESIEQTVISALQQSEAMRHSILKQAFGAISKE